MLENLDVFRLANAMAIHAGKRQATIAQNIAHADTPGYKAQRMGSFANAFESGDQSEQMRATRAGHLEPAIGAGSSYENKLNAATESPNGNTVSLEHEMMQAAEARHQHDTALTIYQTSLGILRTSLGRR